MPTLFVALGGALGCVARYHLVDWAQQRTTGAVPWGTFAVNVLGSMLLGALTVIAVRSEVFTPGLRLALTSGMLGGFTTYSAFNAETLALAQRGAWAPALLYVGTTLVGCWVAGLLGWLGARALVG
jgi:fluoride exporter